MKLQKHIDKGSNKGRTFTSDFFIVFIMYRSSFVR
jgi:hypothetical protein